LLLISGLLAIFFLHTEKSLNLGYTYIELVVNKELAYL